MFSKLVLMVDCPSADWYAMLLVMSDIERFAGSVAFDDDQQPL